MGKYSFEKGVNDGKNGNEPQVPENHWSDHIFQTHLSDEKLKEEQEDYMKGYTAGSSQSSKETDKK